MNYVFDTNILLIYLRDKELTRFIDEKYNPLNLPNKPIISVVSVGEIKSLALQNAWGRKKQEKLNRFLDLFLIADINVKTVIERYAEIDAFSQGKFANMALKSSSRNMGKNDLWIASTASVLSATLLSADKDFIHLDKEYLNLAYIDIKKV